MCGARPGDEVGLEVKIRKQENIYQRLSGIRQGERGAVDSHRLWRGSLEGVRHREATHHAFLDIANASA